MSTGAILFTDMAGSTALRSRLGDDRADVLRKHHDVLLAAAVEAHHGTVLRWTGDGIKAAFASSSDAVAAAVEIQRAVARYGTTEHAVAAFQVRIGLGPARWSQTTATITACPSSKPRGSKRWRVPARSLQPTSCACSATADRTSASKRLVRPR